MPPRNKDLPTAIAATVFRKSQILDDLVFVDSNDASRARVLALEYGFRTRVADHVASLPRATARLASFSTSPFVLMVYAHAKSYQNLSQIEGDILPAKLFSSMETSAGRMVEDVTLPVYGWQPVLSGMHSANSALDGIKVELPVLHAATLKSGPRCLNDEMSENFADNVLNHGQSWMHEHSATRLEFTYGVLYGTKKLSNKKDWHILRKIVAKLPEQNIILGPSQRWNCEFLIAGNEASATVRIGKEWWDHLGGSTCLMEVCVAMIRACVVPGQADAPNTEYVISDLGDIVRMPPSRANLNVALLQASQYPWLFFLMRHFCDELLD